MTDTEGPWSGQTLLAPPFGLRQVAAVVSYDRRRPGAGLERFWRPFLTIVVLPVLGGDDRTHGYHSIAHL
jgi:hypothetical protein